MIKYVCDCCKAEVNNYGHWYKGEMCSLYELKTIYDFDKNSYDGMIICRRCIERFLESVANERNEV